MTLRACRFQPVVAASITAILSIGLTAPAMAQDAVAPAPPAPDPAAQAAPDLDQSFAALQAPGEGEGWKRAESDILRSWSRSGSAGLDLLRQRGLSALDEGDAVSAIGHLTALTDHAPDYGPGFVDRASAYAAHGDYGPAAADLARALAIEPRNFLALTQLGTMLEDMGDHARALSAFRASLAIHPHQPEALDAVARLERGLAGTAL